MIIAIDGPSASGKGTLARKLAAHFNLPYLDTGALYRAVALKLLIENRSEAEATNTAWEIKNGIPPALLDNPELRSEKVGLLAGRIAALPDVRQHLLDYQKQFANQPHGAVLDGRDIGTVIAPHAKIKIFVNASAEKRAERRWKELQSSGLAAKYEAVLKDMQERDARDAARTLAPTKPAADAVLLATDDLDADAVFAKALLIIGEKMGQSE